MKVEIKLDPNLEETKVTIYTPKIDEEVLSIEERLNKSKSQILSGFSDDKLVVIDPENIIRVYSYDGKVFVITESREYTVRLTLYETKDRLDKNKFVKISRSDIINIKKVKNFDLSFVGTISVEMVNGDLVYVSRRNLKAVKELLGV